jgi:dGTP triphosphohydrolase
MADSYEEHVAEVEAQNGVGPFGFHTTAGLRIDGEDVFSKLSDEWKSPAGKARLEGRTPATLDRDRILYSDEFRRQDDKFHVLFLGATRLKRTYTSHATKVAQVARSVADRLNLNADLAEAIVLGNKVGGVPFLHVGKFKVADWVESKVKGMDVTPDLSAKKPPPPAALFKINKDGDLILPSWIDGIQSPDLQRDVSMYIPWAAGSAASKSYASGQESYWMLSLNPFTLAPSGDGYLAQTMYGIWRHSLLNPKALGTSFAHEMTIGPSKRSMSEKNVTLEAMVVRYADDISWVIENLTEASRVAAVDATTINSPFKQLAGLHKRDFPEAIQIALYQEDAGALYTFFIDDLVQTSRRLIEGTGGTVLPNETAPLVELSDIATRVMNLMKEYLSENIFKNQRMRFREETLNNITGAALDVLYDNYEGELTSRIERLAKLGRWAETGELDEARSRLQDPVHRVQVVVDVMASMSDHEVFELVGLE